MYFSGLYFSRIYASNLMLIVVRHDVESRKCTVQSNGETVEYTIGAEAMQITYNFDKTTLKDPDHIFPCHKKILNKLEHRPLDDCFTEDCRVS